MRYGLADAMMGRRMPPGPRSNDTYIQQPRGGGGASVRGASSSWNPMYEPGKLRAPGSGGIYSSLSDGRGGRGPITDQSGRSIAGIDIIGGPGTFSAQSGQMQPWGASRPASQGYAGQRPSMGGNVAQLGPPIGMTVPSPGGWEPNLAKPSAVPIGKPFVADPIKPLEDFQRPPQSPIPGGRRFP